MTDIALNPQSLVTAGAVVSTANPLPCTSAAAGTPATDVTLSPVVWVVNGDIVSASNPLPITLS